MKPLRTKNLGTALLMGFIGVSLLTALAFSVMMYRAQMSSAQKALEDTAQAVLRPIRQLAIRGINGGNIMKLRNADALSLYEASELRYLHMSGTSEGSPKSAFMEAVPPKPIEFEYVPEGTDPADMKALLNVTESAYLDTERWVYVIRAPLSEVTNGGQLLAVFPADQLRGTFAATLKSVATTSIAILLISLAAAIVGGRWISRPIVNISRQVSEISKTLNIGRRVEVDTDNEIGEMAGAFNHLLEKVQNIIGQVQHASERLASGAGRMDEATHEASRRVQQQQAQSLTASDAVQEMSLAAEEVARNAEQAAHTATEADRNVSDSKHVMLQTVSSIRDLAGSIESATDTVQRLGADSESIGGVLDVIRGIAEQTNLLALNAAIEAARAGESGRGFAVVADEVRTLASRTQEATQEIQTMIERLQLGASEATKVMAKERERASQSVQRADRAGSSLDQITSAVTAISSMTSQISIRAGAQTALAQQVQASVEDIRKYTELANEEVRGSANSSREFLGMAQEMGELLGQFRG